MNDFMCKGDSRLGTACGKCSRCVAAEAIRPENQRVYPVGTDRNWQAELDAQRLRADTAEAELKREKEFHAVNVSESERMLAAAERLNADLIALIGKAHTWVDRNNCGGWDAYELRDQLAAALNPNPEEESHE